LVTEEKNELLTKPFTEEEIKDVVFSCYSDGASGSHGISFMFYQKFWEIVKDLLACLMIFTGVD
jgi:hypothetical protein